MDAPHGAHHPAHHPARRAAARRLGRLAREAPVLRGEHARAAVGARPVAVLRGRGGPHEAVHRQRERVQHGAPRVYDKPLRSFDVADAAALGHFHGRAALSLNLFDGRARLTDDSALLTRARHLDLDVCVQIVAAQLGGQDLVRVRFANQRDGRRRNRSLRRRILGILRHRAHRAHRAHRTHRAILSRRAARFALLAHLAHARARHGAGVGAGNRRHAPIAFHLDLDPALSRCAGWSRRPCR